MDNLDGQGSSPRVWGASQRQCPLVADRRFIPTCVGSISKCATDLVLSEVHPHVCGEHWLLTK